MKRQLISLYKPMKLNKQTIDPDGNITPEEISGFMYLDDLIILLEKLGFNNNEIFSLENLYDKENDTYFINNSVFQLDCTHYCLYISYKKGDDELDLSYMLTEIASNGARSIFEVERMLA